MSVLNFSILIFFILQNVSILLVAVVDVEVRLNRTRLWSEKRWSVLTDDIWLLVSYVMIRSRVFPSLCVGSVFCMASPKASMKSKKLMVLPSFLSLTLIFRSLSMVIGPGDVICDSYKSIKLVMNDKTFVSGGL